MPRVTRFTFVLLAALLAFPFCARSFELPPPEPFHKALSLQGYTGILNAPNAHVTEEGDFYALYTNQKESAWRDRVPYQDNYLFSVGFFGFAEVGGRLFEAPGAGRDLSANFKLTTDPFFKQYSYVPTIAVGIQDVGGGAKTFNTTYGVVSEDLWRFRFSAGYAKGGSSLSSKNGAFGGAEFKAHEWVYLLSEYDTRETNVGVRLVTPEFFGIPVNLQATAKSSLSHKPGNVEFGVGLQFPLGWDHYSRVPAAHTGEATAPVYQAQPAVDKLVQKADSVAAKPVALPETYRVQYLEMIQAHLAEDGFQNLRVGELDGHTLVVELENSRYNSNALDGIGVAAGIIADVAPVGFDTIRLVLKKKGIRMLELRAPLADLTGFMADAKGLDRLRASLTVSPDISDTDRVHFVSGTSNPSWLRPTLVLAPGLNTYIGTDFGVFDYLLSLKPELLVPLWPGAVVNARWDLPITWSNNFDDGRRFRNSRQPAHNERVMLFQAVKLAPTVMANIGAGKVLPHLNGTLNELVWTPGDATHRFGLRQAYVQNDQTSDKTDVYLGFYRYRYAPLDLSLEVTGGRFFYNDTGALVELKRFFGDTLFTVYYKDVDTAQQQQHLRSVGAQFTFPLSPRRDMKATVAQVKGIDNWAYSVETVIAQGSNGNALDHPPLAVNPTPAYNISDVFYDRDRLSEVYIKLHLLRLRDAYLRYVRGQ